MEARFIEAPYDASFIATAFKPSQQGGTNAWQQPAEVSVLINNGWQIKTNGVIEYITKPSPEGQYQLRITATGSGPKDTNGIYAAKVLWGSGGAGKTFVGTHQNYVPDQRKTMVVDSPVGTPHTVHWELSYFGGDPEFQLAEVLFEFNGLARPR